MITPGFRPGLQFAPRLWRRGSGQGSYQPGLQPGRKVVVEFRL
jgi:hypothetical protein